MHRSTWKGNSKKFVSRNSQTAYEDMPSGVYAVPRPDATIRPILKPGVLYLHPPENGPAFLLSAQVIPARTPNFAFTVFSRKFDFGNSHMAERKLSAWQMRRSWRPASVSAGLVFTSQRC
jgi:hypothetical protein